MITTLLASTVLSQSISIKKTVASLHVTAIAAAPSGSKVAITTDDGAVRIFDANAGSTVKQLGQHPQPAYAVAWSPNGKWIASGDETARIWIWDVASGKKIKELRTHTRGLQRLSFNKASNILVSCGKDDSIRVYDLKIWKEKKVINGGGANFYGGRVLPNSDSIGTSTLLEGGRIYAGGKTVKLTGHGGQGALDFDVNPTGSLAATAGKDAVILLWSTSGASKGALKGHTDLVSGVRFSPNGKLLASSCGTERTVKIWNVASRAVIGTLTDASAVGSPLGWTADGRFLLSTDVNEGLRIAAIK